jgi:hypothetical protein
MMRRNAMSDTESVGISVSLFSLRRDNAMGLLVGARIARG